MRGATPQPTAGLPGLRRVQARLPKSTGDDLVSVVHAVQEAQTKLLMLVDPVVVDLGAPARFLIEELESGLELLLDDDVEEEANTQLAALQSFHAQSAQHQALRDYAALAYTLKARLIEVDEDFNPALIEEAQGLNVPRVGLRADVRPVARRRHDSHRLGVRWYALTPRLVLSRRRSNVSCASQVVWTVTST